jgi:hypothetical protein
MARQKGGRETNLLLNQHCNLRQVNETNDQVHMILSLRW